MTSAKNSLKLVDPELRPILDVFTGFDVTAQTLPMLREMPCAPALEAPSFKQISVKSPSGNDIRTLLITPDGEAPKQGWPALLYMHGGGFVFGSPETILPTLQKVSKDVGCVIVVPAYRLAPEHPFPAALVDNYCTLKWMHESAQDLNIDTARIAIGGDSAGGGHAAVLSAAINERAEFLPVFQLLIYPMLDDRTGSTRLAPAGLGEFIWTPDNNVFGWSSYLGCEAGRDDVPVGAVPARNSDVSGMAPTLIASGDLDLFWQENFDYAERLKNAGVEVEFGTFKGAFHGFNVMLPDTAISRRFHALCVKALKKAFTI